MLHVCPPPIFRERIRDRARAGFFLCDPVRDRSCNPVVKGRQTGGCQTGGFPDLDLSFLFCPFLSFLGLSRFFWDFPDLLGDGPGISRFVPFLFLGLLRAPTRNSPERVRDTIWTFPEKSGKHPGLETPRFSSSQCYQKRQMLLFSKMHVSNFRCGKKKLRTRSTTTRDRNLQFRGAVSTGGSPLIFCFFSKFCVQFSKTSPLKSGERSEKSSGENRVKSCHVCGCHGFFGPEKLRSKWQNTANKRHLDRDRRC